MNNVFFIKIYFAMKMVIKFVHLIKNNNYGEFMNM